MIFLWLEKRNNSASFNFHFVEFNGSRLTSIFSNGRGALDICLPEAGDIVTLPMKSVSLVVAYSSMLFPKLFQALHGSSWSPLDCLSPFGRLALLEAMRLFKSYSRKLLNSIKSLSKNSRLLFLN